MPTLYIFCEGYTEATILCPFLKPYWEQRFSECEVARRYDGKDDLAKNVRKDAHEYLSDPDVFILCVVDLYEAPFRLYDPNKHSYEVGFRIIQKALYDRIDPLYHARFGAFPIVMELETWLLADKRLQQELFKHDYSYPETIPHPATALGKVYSNYRKGLNAKSLFEKASAKRVYEDTCPHFQKLIDWLIAANPTQQKKTHEQSRYLNYKQQLEDLQAQADEALRYCEEYLAQGQIEQAVEWDERYKQYEQQLNELSLSLYSD